MHDVAERLEVGVLKIRSVEAISETSRVFDFEPTLIPEAGYKLVIQEAGTTLESGLKLCFESGSDLVILPADFPFFLAVCGNCLPQMQTVPEYNLEAYQAVQIFGATVHQGN